MNKVNIILEHLHQIETKKAKSLSDKEKEFLLEIRSKLTLEQIIEPPKPRYITQIQVKKDVFKFDLPILKETKLNTIEKLENFLEGFKDKEKIALYDLKFKEVIFLNKARNLVRKIKNTSEHSSFKLKEAELEFLDNLKELVERIQLKETELLEKLESNKKKSIIKRHVARPSINQFIQPQDKISFLNEMQRVGMTIVDEEIPLERKISSPKPKYLDIPKWPTIEEFKVVNNKDSRELQKLTSEENRIIYKMTEAEKIKLARLNVSLPRTHRKQIEQENIRLTVEQLRNKDKKDIELLQKEEEELRHKMSSVKPKRFEVEHVKRESNSKQEYEWEHKLKKIVSKESSSISKLNKEQEQLLHRMSEV